MIATRTGRSALKVTLGTVLLIAAVSGFVLVREHKPSATGYVLGSWGFQGGSGNWSRTTYDAARIGTWTLLIVGAVMVAAGLISYARQAAR